MQLYQILRLYHIALLFKQNTQIFEVTCVPCPNLSLLPFQR